MAVHQYPSATTYPGSTTYPGIYSDGEEGGSDSGIETTTTWANLMREAKITPEMDARHGHLPDTPSGRRGSLY